MDNDILQRWKGAIVHLECATDSLSWDEQHRKMNAAIAAHKSGSIGTNELSTQLSGESRDIRCHGTAVFVQTQNGRYLITARHVVFDEIQARREIEED